jgi:alanine racemase
MFLGDAWHFGLCRPGVALYGVNPTPGRPNPMRPVVTLEAPAIQLHEIGAVGTVGYGAARAVWPGERIVTVPVGYADGFPRLTGSPAWSARLQDWELPLAGRVSMDLMSLDASAVPADLMRDGRTAVELIGGPDGVDRLAAAAGTIGYEILTRLGRRFERVYLDEDGTGSA